MFCNCFVLNWRTASNILDSNYSLKNSRLKPIFKRNATKKVENKNINKGHLFAGILKHFLLFDVYKSVDTENEKGLSSEGGGRIGL